MNPERHNGKTVGYARVEASSFVLCHLSYFTLSL
jgi:hypothetical protein